LYSSIIYLEPFTNRNLRAFGYDMFNEPVRREAMERARDQDTAALSGKVTLVQETGQEVQAGTLMYVPFYRRDLPHETIPQRRAAILGWAYSPYRMNDLLSGILGNWDQAGQKRIRLEIFDGDQVADQTRLFDSQAARSEQPSLAAGALLSVQSRIVLAGRPWALCFTRTGSQAGTVDYSKVWLVGFGGGSLSLFLAALTFLLLSSLGRAQQLALELKQSEERYRTMLDGSPHAVFLTDESGRIRMANQVAATLTGRREAQDLMGGLLADLVSPAERADVQVAIQTILRQGFTTPFGCTIPRLDGTVACAELSGTLVKDFQGLPQAVQAIMQDVTGRKRVEDELRRVSILLSSVIQGSSDVIAMLDQEFRYVLFNRAFQAEFKRIFGKDLKLGDSMPQALAHVPDDLALALEYWKRALGGEDFIITQQFGSIELERHWYDLHFSPIKDGTEKVVGAVHIVRNVTERQRLEETLKRSEQRLELALKATQEAVWDWDLLANTLYYSPAWFAMIGFEGNELQADPELWRRRLHPEDVERAGGIVSEALKNRSSFQVEVRLLHKDGHYVPVQSRGFIMRDSLGNPLRISGTNADLTSRQRFEAEREKLQDQAHQLQKAESLSRMAGAIAHHFNNQLAAVMLGLDLAQEGLAKGSAFSETLADVMQSARQAAEVSTLMLTYLGQIPAAREPLDLSVACQRSLALLHTLLPKSVCFLDDLPSPGPAIDSSLGQIQQILNNLITNAWEASGEGGSKIRLSVQSLAAEDILAAHRFPLGSKPEAPAYACLSVADNGCGIPPQDIDKIFDPFFSTKFPGRGLGLPVVLGIVRSHHGFITVESQTGQGSTFRIFLPLSAEVVASKPALPVPTLKAAKGEAILLAEDESSLRSAVARALKLFGYRVYAAEDGVEAVELFKQHQEKIICVLSDLTMPRMDGWEAISAIRQISPGTPIILSSGYNESRAMAGGHGEQPQAFLSKPYDFKELKKTLERVLESEKTC
jgi:PAS domain S-box-containing protein